MYSRKWKVAEGSREDAFGGVEFRSVLLLISSTCDSLLFAKQHRRTGFLEHSMFLTSSLTTPSHLCDLPSELLTLVAENLSTINLCTLAQTCSQLRDIAESVLYRDIFLRTGKKCSRLFESLTTKADRYRLIHSVELRGKYRFELGMQDLPAILRHAPNLQRLTIESPACNSSRWHGDGNWPVLLPLYIGLLQEAVPSPVLRPSLVPLQSLRSLTLHWNGCDRRYWSVVPLFTALFCHPSLEELTISCAIFTNAIGDLDLTYPKTPLKRLVLIECDLSIDGVEEALKMPKGLEVLHIGMSMSCKPLRDAETIGVNHNPSAHPKHMAHAEVTRRACCVKGADLIQEKIAITSPFVAQAPLTAAYTAGKLLTAPISVMS